MGIDLSEQARQGGKQCLLPRIVISGLSGGSGKTMLSLGLTRAFCEAGLTVQPFKKGPDYIDAAWLSLAAQRACANLDPYFLDNSRLRDLFAHASTGADMAVIEGNRGLFDGRDTQGTCSTAALSRTLKAPVILALNCTKMTRTAAALMLGVSRFENFCFAGVVLNQIGSGRHEAIVRQCIEDTGIPVLGALPRLRKNPIPERHMGLVGVTENPDAEHSLTRLASFVRDHVDLEAIRTCACAPALSHGRFWPLAAAHNAQIQPRVRLGYVHDRALWFYYPENLEALERAGAELVRLSLFDPEPWPELDGLYLGGGYPELSAPELSASPRVRDIRGFSEAGMPIYAECGGFMVLCEMIQAQTGIWPMACALKAKGVFEARPQGLGYVEAQVVCANPFHPVGAIFRGHEFHYSRCDKTTVPSVLRLLVEPENATEGGSDYGPCKGTGMGEGEDGLCLRRTFGAYTHLYAPAVPHWAPNFVSAAAEFRREKGQTNRNT